MDRDTLAKISSLFFSVFVKQRASGIPDIDRLSVYEQQLAQLFGPDMQEDDDCRLQLKQVAFYAASKKGEGLLVLQIFECFLKGYVGCCHPRCGVGAGLNLAKKALSNLHILLLTSGCQGVRRFLAEADQKGWEMSRQECDQLCTELL